MNIRQVMGVAGGFLIVYVVITLTNKPTIVPRSPRGELPRTGEEAAQGGANAFSPGFMKGLTLSRGAAPAWDGPRFQAALANLKALGAEWVAFSPAIGQATGSASSPNLPDAGAASDLAQGIQAAHMAGLKAFVRPVVVSQDGTQRGFIEPGDPNMWFAGYRKALAPLLRAAASERAELFSLGTGLSRLSSSVPWDQLARETRRDYHGYLTYEAAWADMAAFPHWASLDYAGAQVDLSRPPSISGPPDGVAGKPVVFTSVAGPGGQGMAAFMNTMRGAWAQGAFVAAYEVEADKARPNPYALNPAALHALAEAYGGKAPEAEPSPQEVPSPEASPEAARPPGEGNTTTEGTERPVDQVPPGGGGSEAGTNALEAPPLDPPSPTSEGGEGTERR